MIPLLILFSLGILIFLVIPLICFYITFYVPKPKDGIHPEVPLPNDEVYAPYKAMMDAWTQEVLNMPHEHFTITSFDGLELHGNFYEYAPGAPIELMFHGYRGSALRDLSGGVARCFALKRSCIIVDQRCSGRSQGTVITFGIKEHRDCLTWVDFMVDHFGPNVKIILTGISMGASTVLMAAGNPLPDNVVAVLADCGYTSAKQIIQKVIRDMRLPLFLYFFARLGARLFGGFDPEETSPIESVKKTRLPIIFYHGDTDDFVPCEMSEKNYEACVSRKRLVIIKNAGHGLCYPVDPETYVSELKAFFG